MGTLRVVSAILALLALTALLNGWQQPARVAGSGGLPANQQIPVLADCAIDGDVANAVTGEPVPRARVMLNSAQSYTVADNSGHWSFSSIACGPIQITVSRPGFLNGNLGQASISGAPFVSVSNPGMLTSGSPVHGLRIRLTPTSVITGKVVDDQGDPVMNAQLTLSSSRVVDGRRSFVATGVTMGGVATNDLGEFRLAGLNAGKYIVCARANQRGGGDSTMLGESCYPGPVGDDGGATAGAFDLAAGREARVDFTLREVTAVHVRGTISGLPKSQGVRLTLVRRGVSAPANANAAKISPDGKFDVAGVAPGSYLLSTDYFESGVRLVARVRVEVGDSDVDDVAVRLESAFTVTGKVRIESKTGNAPDRQFAVSLRSADPMAGGASPQWSPDHLTFTIADLTPGSYRMEAQPPGKFFVESATIGGRDLLGEEIPMTQAAGPIEIVLSDNGGAIDAQVTDAGDQPVPAAWVMVLREGGRSPRNAMAGLDGHATVQGLAPGDYRVYAWDDFRQVEYADPDWMQRFGVKGVLVSVQAGQTERLTLKRQTVPAQ